MHANVSVCVCVCWVYLSWETECLGLVGGYGFVFITCELLWFLLCYYMCLLHMAVLDWATMTPFRCLCVCSYPSPWSLSSMAVCTPEAQYGKAIEALMCIQTVGLTLWQKISLCEWKPKAHYIKTKITSTSFELMIWQPRLTSEQTQTGHMNPTLECQRSLSVMAFSQDPKRFS